MIVRREGTYAIVALILVVVAGLLAANTVWSQDTEETNTEKKVRSENSTIKAAVQQRQEGQRSVQQRQKNQRSGGNAGCSNPDRIERFSGDDDQITDEFRIRGNTFRLRFNITDVDSDPFFDDFRIRVYDEDGFLVESVLVFEEGRYSENVLEGPGTFFLRIETNGFEYDVAIDDCRGNDNDNNDNDNNDNDNNNNNNDNDDDDDDTGDDDDLDSDDEISSTTTTSDEDCIDTTDDTNNTTDSLETESSEEDSVETDDTETSNESASLERIDFEMVAFQDDDSNDNTEDDTEDSSDTDDTDDEDDIDTLEECEDEDDSPVSATSGDGGAEASTPGAQARSGDPDDLKPVTEAPDDVVDEIDTDDQPLPNTAGGLWVSVIPSLGCLVPLALLVKRIRSYS